MLSQQSIDLVVALIRRKSAEGQTHPSWEPVSWQEHGPDDHRKIAEALRPEFECLGWRKTRSRLQFRRR